MNTVVTPMGWYPDPQDPSQHRYWTGQRWTSDRRPAGVYVDPSRPAGAGVVVISDQSSNNAEAAIAWILAILTVGYMLPWAVAASRGKSNSGAIAIINLLLGWTVIGWIVALVMACGAHQQMGVRS